MTTSIAIPWNKHSRSRLVVVSIAALVFVAVLFGVVLTAGVQAATTYTTEEVAFVNLLNNYRVANGRSPLLVSDMISEACYRHNHDMAKYAFFDHYSVKSDWFAANATPWTRMAASGYGYNTSMGENIAAGQRTGAEVFAAWKASAGHNANMLNSAYTVIGISFYQLVGSPYTTYWTTDFGGYKDPTAHTVTATPSLTTTRYEQNNSLLVYSGAWTTGSSSTDSGGSYAYVNSTASVTARFTGTYLAYVARKNPAYGYVKITLDGGTPVIVDLYSASAVYRQKVWDTGALDSGTHTVKLEWTGTLRAAATACNIGLDAFDITGTLVQAPSVVIPATTRYQQNDLHFRYAGAWSLYPNTLASGSSDTRAKTSGASVTVSFTGTYLAWVATKGATLGKAYVSLDSGTAQLVDLALTSTKYQQSAWNTGVLTSGVHTVKIWWYPGNATTKYISVDAFDIAGVLN